MLFMQWGCNRMLLTALLMALSPRKTLPWMARWLPVLLRFTQGLCACVILLLPLL